MSERSVSVIICTYNRASSLIQTLDTLEHLSYHNFEVIVVEGPCTDNTSAVLDGYLGRIKVVRNAAANLSISRNLGIAAAASEIVAFLDDDALSDPDWLSALVDAFDDPEVAATGGPVYDHTGYSYQAYYNLANRWGDATIEMVPRRLDYLDRPDTWTFPYTIGTNSLFRQETIVGLGGFDENFAFYLDETDLCLRIIDRGFRVLPQSRGAIHHRFLPSTIRNDDRITVDRYNVILSKAYFSLRHALPLSDNIDMLLNFGEFVTGHRRDLESHINAKRIPPTALAKFESDLRVALTEATRLSSEPPAVRDREWFTSRHQDFLPFPTRHPEDHRLRICLVSRAYPPGIVHGIGRALYTLAAGLALAGHTVHVITEQREGHPTVDREDGVWVHRIASSPGGVAPVSHLPQRAWDWALSALNEVRRIDAETSVDLVHVPNWDSEGLAVILDGAFPSSLMVVTPVLAVAESDSRVNPEAADVAALANAERLCYLRAGLLTVAFPSTVEELKRLYGVDIPDNRIAIVPLSLPDLKIPRVDRLSDDLEVLFVGRLEPRKGIDTLLAAIPMVLTRSSSIRFTIAGDNRVLGPDGATYMDAFQRRADPALSGRVIFSGEVDDDEVARLLARCDMFVAPSRFESFGLMNLEAMRFGKPVISTNVNGIASVIHNNKEGILVEPGNPAALAKAILDLAADPDLRTMLASNGLKAFQTRYNVDIMVRSIVPAFRHLAQ